jgi:shikimate dehydrogenase
MQTMTDRYVIGNPIQHSKSPLIHGRFAQLTGQDIEYVHRSAVDSFLATLLAFRDGGGHGVNVTTPSLQAFEAATERNPQALQASAVNYHQVLPGGSIAPTIDGVGLVTDLQRNPVSAARTACCCLAPVAPRAAHSPAAGGAAGSTGDRQPHRHQALALAARRRRSRWTPG